MQLADPDALGPTVHDEEVRARQKLGLEFSLVRAVRPDGGDVGPPL
jgi:hypothetical protein